MLIRSSVGLTVAALVASFTWGSAHAAPADEWEKSPVYAKWQALGGAAFAGEKVGDEVVVPGGRTRWAKFSKYDIVITWGDTAGAHWMSGAISRKWLANDYVFKGVPTNDQVPVNRGGQAGAAVDFGPDAAIYYSDAYGAYSVNGVEMDVYRSNGGVTGKFGWPVSDRLQLGSGWEQQFSEAVSIYREPERWGVWISGALRDKFRAELAAGRPNWPAASQMPEPDGGWSIRMTRGAIYWSASTGARLIETSTASWYNSEGGPRRFGYPTSDSVEQHNGFITDFVAQTTFYRGPDDSIAYWISAQVRDTYRAQGGPGGSLGWPRSSQHPAPGTDGHYVLFGENRDKVILWGHRTGGHVVQGAILTKLRDGGDVAVYGLPQFGQLPAGPTAEFQQFENASVFLRADNHVPTLGWDFRAFWWDLGGLSSPLGLPRGDVHPLGNDKFLVQDFDKGLMWCDYEVGECGYSIAGGNSQAALTQTSRENPKFRVTGSGPRR